MAVWRAVFTVKCPTKYVTRESLTALEVGLNEGFRGADGAARRWAKMEIHWLLANTEHERTLCAVAACEGEEAEAGAEGSDGGGTGQSLALRE